MSAVSSTPEVPTIIRETLDRLRKMIHRYVLMQAAVLIAICGVSVFWVTGFIDYFPVLMGSSESPQWARLIMLLGLGGSMAFIGYQIGLRENGRFIGAILPWLCC